MKKVQCLNRISLISHSERLAFRRARQMSCHITVKCNPLFTEPGGPFSEDTGPLAVAALHHIARPGAAPHLLARAPGHAPAQDLSPPPPHHRPRLFLHCSGEAVQKAVGAHKE